MEATIEAKVSLRKRFSRGLRYGMLALTCLPQWGRLAKLQNSKKGKRCFLLANGPSLAELDLSHLAGEDVCVVNMGIRALDAGLPQVTIHVATDKNRYERFAPDMEAYAAKHTIPLRFFGIWGRKCWKNLPNKASSLPFFLLVGRKSLFERGFQTNPFKGYGSCGTVLIIALQMLFYLGYDEVYVAGVDLDYNTGQAYFYAMQEKDTIHEQEQKVQARRPLMNNANDEFAFARNAFEQAGRKLMNVGVGGHLHALPRKDFQTLFEKAPNPTHQQDTA